MKPIPRQLSLQNDFSNDRPVRLAGRLLAIRDMGKSIFFVVGDVEGRIQGYLNKKGVSEHDWEVWHLLDRGDWVGIEGTTFTTGKGEPTVKVDSLHVLAKALRPMPDKWHGVADREIKYRKRHLDLMANQTSADLFVLRSRILAEIRNFFHERGFLEVRDAHVAGCGGRRRGPSLRDSSQCAQHAPHPAHCAGTLSQASAGGWIHQGFRVEPQFPQRGHLTAAQSRVHHAGSLLGLRRL